MGPKHFTRSRFNRLVATLGRLTTIYWNMRLDDPMHSMSYDWELRRRQRLIKILELEIAEMCYQGVHAS